MPYDEPTVRQAVDPSCRDCGGRGWYVNRWGPDDNVEQVQCGCSFEGWPRNAEAADASA